jgi:hypothetical protein
MITAHRLRELLAYDPETGVFRWRVDRSSNANRGDVAGHLRRTGYRAIFVENRCYLAHRLAWLYVHGRWPADQIDHCNGHKDDNRLRNIREASGYQNLANTGPRRNSTTGVKGVCRAGARWRAKIHIRGLWIDLGTHPTIEQAQEAYIRAAQTHFGEFAHSQEQTRSASA